MKKKTTLQSKALLMSVVELLLAKKIISEDELRNVMSKRKRNEPRG